MMMRVLAAVAVAALASGCRTLSSVNEVSSGSNEVDASPYLGDWNLVEIGGESPQSPLVVTVANTGSALTIADGADSEILKLTEVGGMIIASIQDQSGLWDLCRVLLQNEGSRLEAWCADPDVVASDIGSGTVSGTVTQVEPGTTLVKLTASSQELRAYISDHPGVFRPTLALQREGGS